MVSRPLNSQNIFNKIYINNIFMSNNVGNIPEIIDKHAFRVEVCFSNLFTCKHLKWRRF